MEMRIVTLKRELRDVRIQKRTLQDQAMDFTDLSRILEYQDGRINEIKDTINCEIHPALKRIINIVDKRELIKSIRITAANIIKYCIITTNIRNSDFLNPRPSKFPRST